MAEVILTHSELEMKSLFKSVSDVHNGAVCLFAGQVRDNSRGKVVAFLEYRAYEPMAKKEMQRIAEDAEAKWGCQVTIGHRLGKIELGGLSVIIAVGSVHRETAFEACRYCIDILKETVPIWKKETCPDGTFWIEGDEAVKT